MPKNAEEKERIKAMWRLGFTDEEVADVLKCDEAIDHGEKLFELDKEHALASKHIRSTTSVERKASPNYTFEKKERKANYDKREIIELLKKSLSEISENIEVTNVERELTFTTNGVKYRLTLAVPRK